MDANEIAILIKARDEASKVMKDVGDSAGGLGTQVTKGAVIGAAALAGLAAGALKFGDTWDDATDNIAIKTSKTGDELEGLTKSFENVFTSVPVDAGMASDAIGGLNSRLGLTGDELEASATQLLNFSRLTKTDVNVAVDQATRVFGDWSIATEDQAGALDKVMAAGQMAGVSVQSLMQNVVQFGAPMRQLGFSFDETLALLAKFEKEGVNTELVMGSMRIALGKMAQEGEAPVETLNRVMDAIKNAGSAGEANALALEMFGARAGPDMAAAIREGRFAIDDLVAGLQSSEGTIERTAASTDGWREKLTLVKNEIMASVGPYADYVAIAAGIGSAVLGFTAAFAQSLPVIAKVPSMIQAVGTATAAMNIGLTASLGVIGAVVIVLGAAYLAYQKLSGAQEKAARAAQITTDAEYLLAHSTEENIRATRDEIQVMLDSAKANGASKKQIEATQQSLDIYNEAIGKVDASLDAEALSHDGVTQAAEKMNGVIDKGAEATTAFDEKITNLNETLASLTSAAGEAFGAIDQFKNVPTQEQLNLAAAIADTNAKLADAKIKLDDAKRSGDEVATGIQETVITALDAEKERLDLAMQGLDANRDAAIKMGEAKVGASGAVNGLVESESELTDRIYDGIAAMSGQLTRAQELERQMFELAVAAETAAQAVAMANGQEAPAPGPYTGPAYASGTMSAPASGWALVGEHGPEMRYIRRGETILPADVTRQMLAGTDGMLAGTDGVGGGTVVYGSLQIVLPNVRNGSDFMREIDQLVVAV